MLGLIWMFEKLGGHMAEAFGCMGGCMGGGMDGKYGWPGRIVPWLCKFIGLTTDGA